MLNVGVHVELKTQGTTWGNPGPTVFGQISGFSGQQVEVRIGGTSMTRLARLEDLRLHSAYTARRRAAKAQKFLRTVLVMPGNATGDLFGICVALALNPDLGVLILQEATLTKVGTHQGSLDDAVSGMFGIDNPGKVLVPTRVVSEWAGLSPLEHEPVYRDVQHYDVYQVAAWDPRGRCKAVDIERFLRQSLPPSAKRRIFTLICNDPSSWYGKLTRPATEVRATYLTIACINAQNEIGGLLQGLTGQCSAEAVEQLPRRALSDIALGTRLVGTAKRNVIVKAARGCWRLPAAGRSPVNLVDQACETLLSGKRNRLAPSASRYVVLWVRFSGKRGGPHPQHDTSYLGLTQLIQCARLAGLGVILAGDRSPSSAKDHKLIGSISRVAWDLREIWKDPAWGQVAAVAPTTEHPRIRQLQFFDCVNRKLGGVIHLGMRSGNLEAFALQGHRVYYMEERGIRDEARMRAWHTPTTGQGSTGPRYDRIIIEQPPTRTGKYIVAKLRSNDLRSDNQIHPWRGLLGVQREQTKSEALGSDHLQGFIDEDLDLLSEHMAQWMLDKMNVNMHGITTWP
ncbi:MAG: hypothetical protein IPI49_18255 [Myxococcales bacterium]|nr:hypothetical protein [Myxococcales bacterium]